MKKLLTVVLCTLFIFPAIAQHDPQFSLNMFNNAGINPAAAGMENGVSASALIREQWIGFEGNPSTSLFNVNTLVPWDVLPFGTGLSIMQDQVGFSKNILLDLSIAPQFEVAGGVLGIGIGVGFNNQGFTNVEWLTAGGQLPSGDPVIPKDESVMALDLSFGAHYQTSKMWLGISARHLNGPTLEFNQNSSTYLKQTFYVSGGYHIALPNPLLILTPSVFIKSDALVTQIDLNAVVEFDRRFWGGVTYRLEDAYVAMVGMHLQGGFSFGMAWDFPASEIGTYTAGSVEFFGRYVFDLGLNQGQTKRNTVKDRG